MSDASSGPAKLVTPPQSVRPPNFFLDDVYPNAGGLLQTGLPLAKLAETALFVIDTNCLIDLYGVNSTPFETIASLLTKLAEQKRLYAASRTIKEFVQNRPKEIKKVYDKLCKAGVRPPPTLADFGPTALFPPDDYNALSKSVDELNRVAAEYERNLSTLKEHIRNWNCDDSISSLLQTLFTNDNIIEPREARDEIGKQFVDGLNRQVETVPGRSDASDSNKSDGGIGDFLIWKSILALGESKKCDVIFVSNDKKDCLLLSETHEGLFPRFDLISRFAAISDGKHFGICNLTRFLKLCNVDEVTVEAAETARIRAMHDPSNSLLPIPHTSGDYVPWNAEIRKRFLRQFTSVVQEMVARLSAYRNEAESQKAPVDILVTIRPLFLTLGEQFANGLIQYPFPNCENVQAVLNTLAIAAHQIFNLLLTICEQPNKDAANALQQQTLLELVDRVIAAGRKLPLVMLDVGLLDSMNLV